MIRAVSSEIVIDLPRDQVWEKLRDISLAHNYFPSIARTEIVTATKEGVGASRYVYRGPRSHIQETVEEWQDGVGFLIRLHRGDRPAPPFRAAWFRYQLADEGPDRTRLTGTLTYEMPWGALGRLLEGLMAPMVQGIVRDIACGMKLFYETGEPTTPETLKAYKASLKVS